MPVLRRVCFFTSLTPSTFIFLKPSKKMADATVSAAGLRIVKLLVGNPPQTVSDLIDSTGVTRTAITEQLNELVAGGFVEKSTEKLSGRGRPRHLYQATDASLLLLFTTNQKLVVPAIWKSIQEIGGDDLKMQVLKKVGQLLANHYLPRITAKNPEDRLKQLMELMNEEGSLVEVREVNGDLVLLRRSCPFISMVDEERAICTVDQDVMSHVVGKQVRRSACRHDGAPCCTFEIVSLE